MEYLKESVQGSICLAKTAYREWDKKQIAVNDKNFKKSHSYEQRKEESDRILVKYPNRIPIIVERYNKGTPQIDRKKYLAPEDLSMANFLYVIRKRLKLTPEKSIFLFINNKIVNMTQLLSEVYDKHGDEDGFLYIKYCEESTFG